LDSLGSDEWNAICSIIHRPASYPLDEPAAIRDNNAIPRGAKPVIIDLFQILAKTRDRYEAALNL